MSALSVLSVQQGIENKWLRVVIVTVLTAVNVLSEPQSAAGARGGRAQGGRTHSLLGGIREGQLPG